MEKEQINTSMSAMMVDKMAATLLDNVDGIAGTLRIDVGDGGRDEKLARLLACLVMDRITGRVMMDPPHMVERMVKDAESAGHPIPFVEQDILASNALEAYQYWGGNRDQSSDRVLWRMLLSGSFPLEWPMSRVNGIIGTLRGFVPPEKGASAVASAAVMSTGEALSEKLQEVFSEQPIGAYFDSPDVPAADKDAALNAIDPCLSAVKAALEAYHDAVTDELLGELADKWQYDAYRDGLREYALAVGDSNVAFIRSSVANLDAATKPFRRRIVRGMAMARGAAAARDVAVPEGSEDIVT